MVVMNKYVISVSIEKLEIKVVFKNSQLVKNLFFSIYFTFSQSHILLQGLKEIQVSVNRFVLIEVCMYA